MTIYLQKNSGCAGSSAVNMDDETESANQESILRRQNEKKGSRWRLSKLLASLLFGLVQLVYRQRQKHVIGFTTTHHIFRLLPKEWPDF